MAWQDKMNNVIDLYKDILRAVEGLATCPYAAEAFTELLSRIQAAACRALAFALFSAEMFSQIDRPNLEGYANLEHWVAELDKKIEGILLQRLKHVVQVWCAEPDRSADDSELRRDPIPSKCRGDKQQGKRVSVVYITAGECGAHEVRGGYDSEAYRTRSPDTEPSHLPRPSNRKCAPNVAAAAARLAR
jgi:hypothetical protein